MRIKTVQRIFSSFKRLIKASRKLKLDSLNEFATTNTIGNAVGGIVSAITAPIQALGSAIGGGGEQSNELAEIKSILQQILAKETDIYLDTTKVGTGFAVGTSKVQ